MTVWYRYGNILLPRGTKIWERNLGDKFGREKWKSKCEYKMKTKMKMVLILSF